MDDDHIVGTALELGELQPCIARLLAGIVGIVGYWGIGALTELNLIVVVIAARNADHCGGQQNRQHQAVAVKKSVKHSHEKSCMKTA